MTVKNNITNLRQFILSNVKQCTDAPSNIQHANDRVRIYVRAKAKPIKAYKCAVYAKKEIVSNVPLKIDVLIELSGIMTQCHAVLHLILATTKTL